MNLEMIRPVFEDGLHFRKLRNAYQKREESYYRDGIESRTDSESDYAAAPEAGGSSEAFDLAA